MGKFSPGKFYNDATAIVVAPSTEAEFRLCLSVAAIYSGNSSEVKIPPGAFYLTFLFNLSVVLLS